jgi:hypothetical protein
MLQLPALFGYQGVIKDIATGIACTAEVSHVWFSVLAKTQQLLLLMLAGHSDFFIRLLVAMKHPLSSVNHFD